MRGNAIGYQTKRKETILRLLLAAALIIIGALAVSITTSALAGRTDGYALDSLRACSAAVGRPVREALREAGYGNAGVMVSYTYEEGNGRLYVQVHHDRIGDLTEDEIGRLEESVREVAVCAAFGEEEGMPVSVELSGL
ncbi:MAG: hypothetical protein K5891_00860 [Lachnospiraceae bacterium]|nr:hypothetical protein [Lachnospiraceae bacterium]